METIAPRRARRVWGVVALGMVLAVASWLALAPRTDASSEAVRRGVGHVLRAVGSGPRSPELRAAGDAFRDALRAAPLDPYPAFLLQLCDRLESPATLDPDGGAYERALSLLSGGLNDAALLLLARRVPAAGTAEGYLLRFLREAATLRVPAG
jgi:hypothetical protein